MGPDDLLQLLVYFFTTAGVPFLQIENAYFVRFVEILVSLAPGCTFKLPRRTKFAAEVAAESESLKSAVSKDIQLAPGKVSLAFDGWTSTNQLPFLTVTGHYIDKNWKLRRQLVAFKKFLTPHTGERTAKKLHDILRQSNLKRKLLAMCGDSASSNLAGVVNLELAIGTEAAGNKDPEELKTWSALENYLSCSAHVINLVAQEVCAPFIVKVVVNGQEVEVDNYQVDRPNQPATLQAPTNLRNRKGIMHSALSKLGGAARKRNQSPSFTESWNTYSKKHKISPLKLVKAAPTRWNSRFHQIDTALRMRPVYDDVMDLPEHSHFRLSNTEWGHLEWLHGILKVLNRASQKLSSSKEVTISEMVPTFNKIFNLLEDKIEEEDLFGPDDNQYERQERRKGLRAAHTVLSKYYAFTSTCPWYTFATSKYSLLLNSVSFKFPNRIARKLYFGEITRFMVPIWKF